MKIRIYYNGYKDKYIPQYKWFGLWRRFSELRLLNYMYYYEKQSFDTKDEAVSYLNDFKVKRQEKLEKESTAKDRSKKNGVVYEDVM